MKLAELFRRPTGDPEIRANVHFVTPPKKNVRIKRDPVKDNGNDKIIYLGTDAIERSFSAGLGSKRRIKKAGRISIKQSGETLWLDNPTATPSSATGY
jgi:hypothetical protein